MRSDSDCPPQPYGQNGSCISAFRLEAVVVVVFVVVVVVVVFVVVVFFVFFFFFCGCFCLLVLFCFVLGSWFAFCLDFFVGWLVGWFCLAGWFFALLICFSLCSKGGPFSGFSRGRFCLTF